MDEHRLRTRLMGSDFELVAVSDHPEVAQECLNDGVEEISRIEDLLSEFRDSSETSLINAKAGITPVQVSEECWQLLRRCQSLSVLTQGAFDITIGPLKQLYQFKRDSFRIPDNESLDQTRSLVGCHLLELLPNNRVYLPYPGMRISFAAVGKGYAADVVRRIWLQRDLQGGVINASGDLTVFGTRADGLDWNVAIANPDNTSEALMSIPLRDVAVATSGDYEQFFMQDNVRYSHTIDPKSGLPVRGIKSTTIICQSAELCDALATSVFVMGTEIGLHFINQFPQTYCIIVDDSNEVFVSDNMNIIYSDV